MNLLKIEWARGWTSQLYLLVSGLSLVTGELLFTDEATKFVHMKLGLDTASPKSNPSTGLPDTLDTELGDKCAKEVLCTFVLDSSSKKPGSLLLASSSNSDASVSSSKHRWLVSSVIGDDAILELSMLNGLGGSLEYVVDIGEEKDEQELTSVPSMMSVSFWLAMRKAKLV